jgi:adenylate cyclase
VIEPLGDLNTLANVYISIGAIHSDVVRDNDEGFLRRRFNGDSKASLAVAHTYTDSAITLWGQIGNALDQHTSYLMLSEIEERQGLPVPALQHYKLYKSMSDSLLNAERDKKLTQLGMQYEFDKKEAATRAAQEKKDALSAEEIRRKGIQRNALLGFAAFGIVFAVVDLRRRRRIKKEHARSEALLLNILPAEVARELKDKGAAQARHFETATILFTDFKGFTQLSEKVTPAELVAELNICFKEFDALMTKYRIEKIKTIGDAYMAAGGLPDPQHGSAADVVRAALEMQEFMKRHKAEREAQGKPYFEMRVGIHSGPVVAGIVGVKKFQYDIWGDTVNTASRMESSGEVGQVNISEATYAVVKNEIDLRFTPRGKVQAKGKGEMEMYFVGRSA